MLIEHVMLNQIAKTTSDWLEMMMDGCKENVLQEESRARLILTLIVMFLYSCTTDQRLHDVSRSVAKVGLELERGPGTFILRTTSQRCQEGAECDEAAGKT